jgi:hypothetical protein
VPEAAGNRMVDPSEFHALAESFEGAVSGGTIFVADGPGAIDTNSELAAALASGNRASLPSGTVGSTILVGTEDDPILLDGDVVLQGDLVIQGWVKGRGSLVATGNVYVPADLQYVDGTVGTGPNATRTFGVAPDGTENALGLAAGGNILIGNFYRKGNKLVTGFESGAFTFVLSEIGIFNRGEWAKSLPMLPTKQQLDQDPSTWSIPNPWYAGPDYLPRYYNFTEGGTVPIYNTSGEFDTTLGIWRGSEHTGSWNGNSLAHPGDTSDRYLYDQNGNPKAVILSLTPGGDWISDSMLDRLIQGTIDARADGPLQVDALLYSNNSIFGLVPKSSPMGGEMVINGGIIAADIGLLVGDGVHINYDPRAHSLLRIEDPNGSGGRIRLRRMLSMGSAAVH